MSQVTEYVIPDSPLTMATLQTTLEELFAAASSANRGSTAPSNPFEGMFWWDSSTSTEILKRYTVAAGWVTIISINITTGVMTISGYVLSSLYDANTILAATTDNTPVAITVAEQTIIGRKTGGNITALTAAEVNTILGGSVLPWVLMTDVKAEGVQGGTALATTENVRVLNTITGVEGDGDQTWCILGTPTANAFTLAVGTYFIDASSPVYYVHANHCALKNSTTSAIVLRGTSEYAYTGQAVRSFLRGFFTVTNATHKYNIIHYTKDGNTDDGLGRPVSDGTELYTTVLITKHS
jgi:hypothetical protein